MHTGGRAETHTPAALPLTLAAIVLGSMLQRTDGFFQPGSMGHLALALALCLAGVVAPSLPVPGRLAGDAAARLALVVGLSLQMRDLLTATPGMYLRLDGPDTLGPFRGGIGIAAVLAGACALPPNLLSRLAFPVLLGTHFLLGVWLIRMSPAPFIDLHPFHKTAIAALARGENPFAVNPPNIYGEGANYGPGMVVDGQIQFGFDYPPLVLVLAAPGELIAGDYRYSYLACMTAAGGLMAAGGGPLGTLAAALYLFTPRGFFVLEQGWTEPASVFLLALTVFLAGRGARAAPAILGLFFISKQHFILALPLGWLLFHPGHERGRALGWWGWLLGAAMGLTLPFLLWDTPAFIRSVVLVHLGMPFRPESLTFSAWLVSVGRERLPTAAGFIALGIAAAVCLWRGARSPAGFAASVALCYAAFFALGRQAFANYYYLVIAALCCAVGALRPGPAVADDTTPPPPGPGRGPLSAMLTRREREVADLVGQGLSNREIATRLVISERTAETHVAHILRKLELKSRFEVARVFAADAPGEAPGDDRNA